ncbi:MAG: hypothetical protein WC253_02340 [Sulfurovaceae bacterium]|nr:hypothetical protein [Sulfurovaceae bacterium]
MQTIDISNLAEENYLYARHLATLDGIIIHKNGIFRINTVTKHSAFEAIDFWRNIALAAEILLKASLLKYEVPFFRKRAHSEYGSKVTAEKNPWLEETLRSLQIEYIAQINTGTLSTAMISAQEVLFEKISYDDQKAKLVSEMIYIIIRTRRNRNNHFFFANQGSIDMSEVEILYLPLLNMLDELYIYQK